MLEQARADGIDIRFNAQLLSRGTSAIYDPTSKYIELCPLAKKGGIRQPASLAASLVHELRHHAQFRENGITAIEADRMSPRIALMWNRICEADAYAFENRFCDILQDRSEGGKNAAFLMSQEKMAMEFLSMLGHEIISGKYDQKTARDIFTARSAPRKSKDASIKTLRSMLSLSGEAGSYLDSLDMNDRRFETLVLRAADRDAFQAVRLMEKLSTAAGQGNPAKTDMLARRLRHKLDELSFR
jgi:hypothetical protein